MANPGSHILILEDDHDDRQLIQSVLEESPVPVPIRFVSSGTALLESLEQHEPLLVMMDFNVQPDTGLELLEAIKRRDAWRHIPVVIGGESSDTDFIRLCYRKGACSYIIKPTSIDGIRASLAGFFSYWLQVPGLPAGQPQTSAIRP
ncbi:response regulator [Flaviaesturariibacter amylovorans]|uniref:Response regulator n=1 Tax=Flaviaesturariibacter amylovorans TaxID=1084520 RepID=A0ABP8H226_9BACT